LEKNFFKLGDTRLWRIQSATNGQCRKGTPLPSAMPMLNFYINRAGSTLPARQKHILTHAKEELREVF